MSGGLTAQISAPYVTSYAKNDYKAGRQNWDIDIDDNGVVYFANTEGLLYNAYDEWGLEEIPGEGMIRAVFAQNDTVWVGGSVLGYFLKHEGKYFFNKIGEPTGAQVWDIQSINNYIIFQTEYELLFLNKKDQILTTSRIDEGEGIWSMIIWNEHLWVILKNGEIGYFENQIFKRISVFEQLSNKEIRKVFIHHNQMYIVTFSGNVYSYSGSELSEIELPEMIKGKKLFSGDSYGDNSFSVGTINNGYYRIHDNGKILQAVNSQSGLIDDTVLEMDVDGYGNVWLGLDYGVARIELQSPFRPVFNGAATYDILDDGLQTYLATNKGLFKEGIEGQYQIVENSGGQVWNLKMIDGELFVCHIKGLFHVENNKFVLLETYGGFIDVARFEGTDIFIFSTYHGLFQVRRQPDGTFTDVINLEIWSQPELAYDKNSKSIWAESPTGVIQQIIASPNQRVEIKEHTEMQKIFDTPYGVLMHDGKSLWEADRKELKLVDDPLLNRVSGKIYALDINKDGSRIAYLKENSLNVDITLPDGKIYSYDKLFTSIRKDIMYDYTHLNLQGENLRITTDRGVVSFDFNFSPHFDTPVKSVISAVYPAGSDEVQYMFPYPETGLFFEKKNRNLMFNFGVNNSYYDLVEFRHKLIPGQNEWSEWSSSESVLFSNLQGGEYTLSVQSRINGVEELGSSLVFVVDKYWHETRWVIIPWVLFLVIFIFVMILIINKTSERRLLRQTQKDKARYAKETIRLKNEQLLQYVEIISHKNEFLNSVRMGLEVMRSTSSKQWARRIEDEVNNEKKEFLFHKLFSEVHQDFMERITKKYPSLTANDIRVLTFIRVNLQNHEIANLMNISPKSLDTTRYRIRKKLDIDHETDLNKFIREF